MVDADRPLTQSDAVQVVHGEDRAALVLVADEAESLALSGGVVPDQVDVDDLSVLAEHLEAVALGQVVGEAADEDPGRVAVLVVPRRRRVRDAHLKLAVVHLLNVLHVRQRIHLDGL